jgi:hypothetical protein
MLEKDLFTSKRLEQLKYNPELLSTECWGKYSCVPLDIPRYNYPELVNWYFDKAKPIFKLKSDIANSEYGMSNFNSVDVFVTDKVEEHIWSINPQQEFLTLFPEVLERILKDFPIKSIRKFVLWSSHKNVRFHRDHTKFVDYPGSFRIMLYDENPIQTLSLDECLPDQPSSLLNQFDIPRLADTNSVAWNNLRVKHGSFFLQNFRKIILIIDWYELDVDRYHDLIERSVNKYKNSLMISNKNLNNFVNL